MFDGVKKLGFGDVLVDAGKASRIAPMIQAPSRAEIIDGHGKTLLPGLFDSRVHIGDGKTITLTLRKATLFGATTVASLFDAGTTPREMHELFRQQPPCEDCRFTGVKSSDTHEVYAPGCVARGGDAAVRTEHQPCHFAVHREAPRDRATH